MVAPNSPEIGRSVMAGGVNTNYLEEGNGAPVLLLHGSGPGVTSYANWRLTIPVLAKNFRVLAMDIAGFGYTERKSGVVYEMDFWVRQVIDFLDALKIPQCSIVGNSFGGALALAVATRYPARVDRIVLMGSGGLELPITDGLEAVWGYEPSFENMKKLISLFAYNQSLVDDKIVESRYQASIRPGYHETYSQLFPAPRQNGLARIATPESALKKMEHRCLIVHGREDKVVPVESSLRLHELILRSELHIFGECGHWTQIEKTDRFNKLVADFLA
jgi:2-hydroxymuconate-semialdehyde hydrolase